MSAELKIIAKWLENQSSGSIESCTFAQLSICVDDEMMTELEDVLARTTRSGVRVSAYNLAMWLVDNWWRLRWEPRRSNVDWYLTHSLASSGEGVAWPDIYFVSDGVHVLVESRETSAGDGTPVRYPGDHVAQISAERFESGVDDFVRDVLARLKSFGFADTELNRLWTELQTERLEVPLLEKRRFEALMGFDCEEAPEDLISWLLEVREQIGPNATEEIATAFGCESQTVLPLIKSQVEKSSIILNRDVIRQFRHEAASSVNPQFDSDRTGLPRQRARRAADLARDYWGIGEGPIASRKLSELFGIREDFLDSRNASDTKIAVGMRSENQGKLPICLRARISTGRRFELMRLVGDDILSNEEEYLLPATNMKTDRQKFQQAFAQEFLLPIKELDAEWSMEESIDWANCDYDDEIEDIASNYGVSPLMVRATLVNRGRPPRELISGD